MLLLVQRHRAEFLLGLISVTLIVALAAHFTRRLAHTLAELRETMVYKAPPELGDLWTKYEKMWKQIVIEQDEAHKREAAKMQIEAARQRRLRRKRKEEAVWVGAILFVVAWYVGILLLLRLSQTYRGLYSSPFWSCVLCS